MNKNPRNSGFVLIAGCARSGTMLLASLIEAEMNVAIPANTMAIPLFQRFLFLWGDVEKIKNRKNLISALIEFLKIWFLFGMRVKDPAKMFEMSIMPELNKLYPSSESNISSFPELIEEIYTLFADRFGKVFKGEQSTTLPVVESWDRSFPGMKVVHLIRDGRDVCLSWLKEWFGPSSVVEVALRWRRHIDTFRRWSRCNPDRYIEVYYEDLVTEKDKELRRISDFLGIKLAKNRDIKANSELARAYSKEGYHPLLSGAIVKNNINKWIANMPSIDQELFELCAIDTLKSCNYKVPNRTFSLPRYVLVRVLFVNKFIKRFFSIRFHRYWIRALTPLGIWLAQKFHVRISSILGLDKNTQGRLY